MAGDLADARTRLGDYHAAMFVSGNAVDGFLQPNQALAPVQQALAAIDTRAWSPGPGTTAALLRAGWPAARIDAPAHDAPQFDSESLWARVAPQARAGTRVLIVRGGGADGVAAGRDWLVGDAVTAADLVVASSSTASGATSRSRRAPARRRPTARCGCSAVPRPSPTCASACPAPTGRPRARWSRTRASAMPRGRPVLAPCTTPGPRWRRWPRR